MKKIIYFFCLIISITFNIAYVINLFDQEKHKTEFISLFKIKSVTFDEGNRELQKRLTSLKLDKAFYLIHIWDTTFLEAGVKIPYITDLDSVFGVIKNKNIDCILMSSMQDKTIKKCLESRKLHFNNLILMNDMDDYISGLCNLRKIKIKPRATVLIDRKGHILIYNDRLNHNLNTDTLLLRKIAIINSF